MSEEKTNIEGLEFTISEVSSNLPNTEERKIENELQSTSNPKIETNTNSPERTQ